MFDHIQRRSDRLLLALAAAGLVAVVVVSLLSVASRIGHLTPGFVTWQNLVVPAVSTTGGAETAARVPLRSVLVAVDGEPLTTAAALRARIEAAPPGHEFTYSFKHHEERTTVVLPTRTLDWSEVLPFVAPYLLNGLVLIVTALIVFYFRPRLPAARAFLALGMTFGGMILLALDAFSAFWVHRLCFALDSLVPGALLHFALCFPEQRAIVRQRPHLKWLVYLPFVILAFLQNYYLTRSAEAHLAVSDWVYAADAAAALIVVASLLHAFLRSGNPIARQQAKAVAAGFAIASFVPAFAILAVVLLDVHIPFNPLTIFLLVCPISIGYAIARHNLFEVDRFLRTGVVYGALSLLVFVTYAGLVIAGEYFMGAGTPLSAEIAALYIVVVLLVANPLRERVQVGVDRLFYRQTYSYRGAVEETSRRLASLLGTAEINATVLRVLTEDMTIGAGVLFVLGDDSSIEAHGHPDVLTVQARSLAAEGRAAVRRLAAAARPLTAYALGAGGTDGAAPSPEAELARALGAVLFVPLRFQNRPTGLLVVGEKRSGAFYSDEDLHLLQTLANQAALAFENARAYEALARTQQSLVQAERLAAVGELAATVAHGIRNPLAGIRLAAQVAQDDRDDPEAIADSLNDIINETDRLEQRVRALLDFTRPFEPNPAPTDLHAAIEVFAADLRQRLPPGIELSTEFAPAVPYVAVDRPQLQEVLEVIVINAAQAMRGAGRIAITVATTGSGATIRITDDGPGIEAAVLGRIFELFFTTKSSGTGIGLAMARRLIERQGGTLRVASEPGKGATFTIELA